MSILVATVVFAIARVKYTNCIANTFVKYNTLQQLYLYHTKPNKRITCLQRCKCMHNYNNINKQVVLHQRAKTRLINNLTSMQNSTQNIMASVTTQSLVESIINKLLYHKYVCIIGWPCNIATTCMHAILFDARCMCIFFIVHFSVVVITLLCVLCNNHF